MSRKTGKVVKVVTTTAKNRQTKNPSKGKGGAKKRTVVERVVEGAKSVARSTFVGVNSSIGHVGLTTGGWKMGWGMYDQKSVSTGGLVAENSVRRGMFHAVTKAPYHKKYGMGVRIIGSQFLTALGWPGIGYPGIFQDYPGGGTLYSTISLNPDQIGGQIALDSRNYTRFRFRKIALINTSSVGTDTTGTFCMAFAPDADADSTFSPSFSRIQSFEQSMVASWREDSVFEPKLLSDDELFYCEYAFDSSASERLTSQGLIFGMASESRVLANNANCVFVYVLDLYCRSADQGFTLSVSDQKVHRALVQRLDREGVLTKRDASKLRYEEHLAEKTKKFREQEAKDQKVDTSWINDEKALKPAEEKNPGPPPPLNYTKDGQWVIASSSSTSSTSGTPTVRSSSMGR